MIQTVREKFVCREGVDLSLSTLADQVGAQVALSRKTVLAVRQLRSRRGQGLRIEIVIDCNSIMQAPIRSHLHRLKRSNLLHRGTSRRTVRPPHVQPVDTHAYRWPGRPLHCREFPPRTHWASLCTSATALLCTPLQQNFVPYSPPVPVSRAVRSSNPSSKSRCCSGKCTKSSSS